MSDNEEEQELQYSVQFVGDEAKYPYLSKDGKGVATFANADTYSGDYKDGARHGTGDYTFSNGAKYSGEWARNQKNGKGTLVTQDGGKYEGDWKENKRDGEGTYTYPNGDKYVGGWKDNLKHGRGIYYNNQTKSQLRGKWVQGKCVYGNWTTVDGTQFTGHFANNQPTGAGIFQFVNGNIQSGEYEYIKKGVREWKEEKFQSKAASEVKPCDRMVHYRRVLDRAALRIDFYGSNQESMPGVPNCNAVSGKLYTCGQPSAQGVVHLMEKLAEAGVSKINWICVRDEPFLYINKMPYSARDKRTLNDKLSLKDVSSAQLTELTQHLQARLQRISAEKGNLDYFESTEAEHPCDRINMIRSVQVPSAADIELFDHVIDKIKEEKEFDFQLSYCPFGNGSGAEEYDTLLSHLKDKEIDGALGDEQVVVFNSCAGLQSATTALVASLIVQRATVGNVDEPKQEEPLEEEEDEEEANEEEDEENENEENSEEDADAPKKKKKSKKSKEVAPPPVQEVKSSGPNYEQGEFEPIMKLVQLLPEGVRVKAEVDAMIDQAQKLINIRSSIVQSQSMCERDQLNQSREEACKPAFIQHWENLAKQQLQTYFNLIAFYSFLLQKKQHGTEEDPEEEEPQQDEEAEVDPNAPPKVKKEKFPATFALFQQKHPELLQLIGSEALANFQWK